MSDEKPIEEMTPEEALTALVRLDEELGLYNEPDAQNVTSELLQIADKLFADWKNGKASYLQFMEARHNYLKAAGLLRKRDIKR